jgi:hypothetical protein
VENEGDAAIVQAAAQHIGIVISEAEINHRRR